MMLVSQKHYFLKKKIELSCSKERELFIKENRGFKRPLSLINYSYQGKRGEKKKTFLDKLFLSRKESTLIGIFT